MTTTKFAWLACTLVTGLAMATPFADSADAASTTTVKKVAKTIAKARPNVNVTVRGRQSAKLEQPVRGRQAAKVEPQNLVAGGKHCRLTRSQPPQKICDR